MNFEIKSVDEYMNNFSEEVKRKLASIREMVAALAPEAAEMILYVKTFKRPLIYFSEYANHIGFYATMSGNKEFANELKK